MAYVTQADLDEQLPELIQVQLTDDLHQGVKDESWILGARESAESEFESYAGARYDLPILNLPEVGKMHIVIGWKYRLYSRRGNCPPQLRQEYEDTLAWYKDLAAGRATLGILPPPTPANLIDAGAVYSEPRVFTRDSLWGF